MRVFSPIFVLLLITPLLCVVACTSGAHRPIHVADSQPRQCPLSTLTEIKASGDDPQTLAFQMAANAAIRAGHEHFSVLRYDITQSGTYIMLIRTEDHRPTSDLYPVYRVADILPANSSRSQLIGSRL